MGCTGSKPSPQPSRQGTDMTSSSYHSQGSTKDQAVSVNIWGRGDPARGDDPAHWGTMLSERGANKGDRYHVRKPGDEFKYERRNDQFVDSTTSAGRSEVSYVSKRGKDRAEVLLDRYGQNPSNIPQAGRANCQNWTAGAVGHLERERLVPAGSGQYWNSQIGRASEDVGKSLKNDGKSWIPSAMAQQPRPAADMRFGAEQRRPVGRINTAAFENLSGPSGRGRGK